MTRRSSRGGFEGKGKFFRGGGLGISLFWRSNFSPLLAATLQMCNGAWPLHTHELAKKSTPLSRDFQNHLWILFFLETFTAFFRGSAFANAPPLLSAFFFAFSFFIVCNFLKYFFPSIGCDSICRLTSICCDRMHYCQKCGYVSKIQYGGCNSLPSRESCLKFVFFIWSFSSFCDILVPDNSFRNSEPRVVVDSRGLEVTRPIYLDLKKFNFEKNSH